jgi:type IV pilus assembly protein PilC
MKNNRRHERIPFLTRVDLIDENGESTRAKTVDISLGGVGVMSPTPFTLGQRATLKFILRDGAQGEVVEQAVATVVVAKSEVDGTLLGFQFVDPLRRERTPHLVKRVERLYRPDDDKSGGRDRGAGAPASPFVDGQLAPFDLWAIAHARVSSKPRKRISLDDTTAFFQQLSTLVSSGTPLLQAIRLCSEQSQSLRMRAILSDIATKVASGSTLHAAAEQHPKIFEHHWIEVIRVGEVTGKMGQVLLELNEQIRESRQTRKKVMAALTYPMVLICVAVGAVTIMLWLVVPTFARMFKDMGAELPGITQFVVDASSYVVNYGIYGAGVLIAIVYLLRRYLKTDGGRRVFGGVGLTIPMIGELLVGMAMYRFSSNIGLLLKSGVPMLETLTTLRGIFQTSPIYREALGRVHARVASGRALAASLEETGLFTSMMTNMVRTGEESGLLALVMEQVAPYYKEKMEALIAKVTKLMEPIIITGMGSTIAGLMLAIYMPMFEMAGKVQ